MRRFIIPAASMPSGTTTWRSSRWQTSRRKISVSSEQSLTFPVNIRGRKFVPFLMLLDVFARSIFTDLQYITVKVVRAAALVPDLIREH